MTGKDLELLRAISDPKHCADAITNKAVRQHLADSSWAEGLSDKQLASRVSRCLRLLREYGLIKKIPRQHKYNLTDKGRKLTTAVISLLAASVEDLHKIAC
ncbi:MAG: hypothetical protein LBU32_15100 [Clostridiales bacterium]|nr:hypothetical protein [Clostridiales bacterium]